MAGSVAGIALLRAGRGAAAIGFLVRSAGGETEGDRREGEDTEEVLHGWEKS